MELDADYGDGYYDDDSVMYDDESEDSYSEEISPFREGITLLEVYENCVIPTSATALNQVCFSVFVTLFFCIVIRNIRLTSDTRSYFSTVCGITLFCHFMGPHALFTILMAMSTYMFTQYSERRAHPSQSAFSGVLCISLAYLVFREYTTIKVITEPWDQVKGIQMIMFMKAVSLSYDVGSLYYSGDSVPTKSEHIGYIMSPATLLFGPWVSYATYQSAFDRSRPILLSGLKRVSRLLMCSFVCLAFSTCGIYYLFLGHESRWIRMVRDAMSVRYSHYFISYLSEALCALIGFRYEDGSQIEVVDIMKIEFPRSLSEVVVNWNKPMHYWLKKHAFLPFVRLGRAKSFLITFLISSTLHGLNFKLTSVLLSLGLYCYVEHNMRETLASTFDACVKSRRCRSNCRHQYKSQNIFVVFANFVLSLIAYFHLSYLGIMLDSAPESEKTAGIFAVLGENLERWSSLGYASHYIMLGSAIFTYMIGGYGDRWARVEVGLGVVAIAVWVLGEAKTNFY